MLNTYDFGIAVQFNPSGCYQNKSLPFIQSVCALPISIYRVPKCHWGIEVVPYIVCCTAINASQVPQQKERKESPKNIERLACLKETDEKQKILKPDNDNPGHRTVESCPEQGRRH